MRGELLIFDTNQQFATHRQEEIFGLKPRSPRKRRAESKQQLGQKRDHRPLHYHTPTRASSRIRFSGGTVAEALELMDPCGTRAPSQRAKVLSSRGDEDFACRRGTRDACGFVNSKA